MAKTSSGKARNTSISRLVKVSVQPPTKPEMMPRVVPMNTDSRVARKAINSDMRLPYTTRLKMSRPFTGSTPIRWSQLIPPKRPIGVSVPPAVSINSWWNSFGGAPRYFTINGANIATKMRKIRNAPPARATLSFFSRIQAICPSERPSVVPAPAVTASGTAVSTSAPNSGGTVNFRLLPRSNVARKLS